MYGKVCAPHLSPISSESHCVKLRAFVRARQHLHEAAIAVLAVTGGDALRDDRAARVAADVDHLRAGVGLLVIVRDRDGVELADRVVAASGRSSGTSR